MKKFAQKLVFTVQRVYISTSLSLLLTSSLTLSLFRNLLVVLCRVYPLQPPCAVGHKTHISFDFVNKPIRLKRAVNWSESDVNKRWKPFGAVNASNVLTSFWTSLSLKHIKNNLSSTFFKLFYLLDLSIFRFIYNFERMSERWVFYA